MALIWFSSVVDLDPHPASGSSILELVIVMPPTRLGFTTSLPSALTLYPRKGMFLLTCTKSFTHILNYIFRSVPRSGIIGSKYVINFTAFEMYYQIVLQKSYSLLPFLWTLALTPYYFEKTFCNLLSKTVLLLFPYCIHIGFNPGYCFYVLSFFHRGLIDIDVKALSPLPNFFLRISEFHEGGIKTGLHTRVSQFCLNPPLNPELSRSIGSGVGISVPCVHGFPDTGSGNSLMSCNRHAPSLFWAELSCLVWC